MPVVRRAAKPFWSSLLERYWPETEDPSNELGSTVSFKAPVFSYVTDLARLFALAKGWVITFRNHKIHPRYLLSTERHDLRISPIRIPCAPLPGLNLRAFASVNGRSTTATKQPTRQSFY